jgi:hypothetical protein
MEAGLEHFDMGLVNYRQHPTNVNYIVYRFKDIERADTFEENLRKEGLWFERSNPVEDEKQIYMFAVEKKHFQKSQRVNFSTEAKHKKFLIPNNALRYFFVLIMLSILMLASLGYCVSRKRLKEESEKIEKAVFYSPVHQLCMAKYRLF